MIDQPVAAFDPFIWQKLNEFAAPDAHEMVQDPDASARGDRFQLADGRGNLEVGGPFGQKIGEIGKAR